MNILDQIEDTVEIDEDTKKVIFHYPNMSAEYDLSNNLSGYYKLMSIIHRKEGGTSFSAATLVEQAGLKGMISINITERDKAEVLKHLKHYKDTTIGLWATDMPELFSDHPAFDKLFELK